MKELLCEYSSNEIPIMIIANKCDRNEHKNRDDLLKEVKYYFGEELNILGKEFLFDKTSVREKTSASLNKILEEIKGLKELTSPSNQFKSMTQYAMRLYSFEIPSYNSREQIEGLTSEEITPFLCL
ncbi:15985_t:CDS:2, partial [Cetraspora pellucida]